MDLAYILGLIREHGDVAYVFVFFYAATNSLLVPLLAGYAAHTGVLDWSRLVAICWFGGTVGDAIRFWVGRRWGSACLKAFPRFERVSGRLVTLVERHYAWMILIHRYPHGIRGVAGFVFGISGLSWPRFLVLNTLSAGIWAGSLVGAGYSFGHVSEAALGEAASGVSLAILVAFLGLAWFLSRKLETALERG